MAVAFQISSALEKPERPYLDRMFNADGALNDTCAVQIGSVNGSQFALVADGRNGLRVLQLISPDTVPGAQGFSPRPDPKLIATYPTKGKAICVSRGLERDRVVDGSGSIPGLGLSSWVRAVGGAGVRWS